MTDDLRQCGDPNGSGDVTSLGTTDPLEVGSTPSNSEERVKDKGNQGL